MEKNIAIEFNNVGKQYRLGLVGTGSLQHDLNRWWQTTILGKEDPYLKIGEVNDRSKKGNSDYVWALKDISFKVEQGDVVGIIGKNGAGKSPLLKLLSHITAPTTGDIRYRGRIASLLEVGTGFHPEMTARQNIYMNGSIMGMTRHEITSKLDEIVDFAGIERYLDTPVKRFSSGMTVRLGFAVAAFLEPEILVVDEVLAVGDMEFQRKAIGKMKDVSSTGGRTVLFVSHNMNAVKTLCNNGIVLKNGLIDYTGSAFDCVNYYLENGAIDKIISKARITEGNRRDNRAFTRDLEIIEAELLNEDAENIATDEPLVFRVFIHKNNHKREKFQYNTQFFDVKDNVVSYYNSDYIDISNVPDDFTIEVVIPVPGLPKGRYYVKMETIMTDMQTCVCFDSCYNVLSFEVTQITKNGPVYYQNWYPEWGLRVHKSNEFDVKLVES